MNKKKKERKKEKYREKNKRLQCLLSRYTDMQQTDTVNTMAAAPMTIISHTASDMADDVKSIRVEAPCMGWDGVLQMCFKKGCNSK
jgi:hypothetical protein